MSYANDAEWFSTRPDCRFRLREGNSLEIRDLQDAGARRHATVVAVRALSTGVRIRAVREIRMKLAGDLPGDEHAQAVYRGEPTAGLRYGVSMLCMDIDSQDLFAQMLREGLLAPTPTVRQFKDGAVTLFYAEGPGWRAASGMLR